MELKIVKILSGFDIQQIQNKYRWDNTHLTRCAQCWDFYYPFDFGYVDFCRCVTVQTTLIDF